MDRQTPCHGRVIRGEIITKTPSRWYLNLGLVGRQGHWSEKDRISGDVEEAGMRIANWMARGIGGVALLIGLTGPSSTVDTAFAVPPIYPRFDNCAGEQDGVEITLKRSVAMNAEITGVRVPNGRLIAELRTIERGEIYKIVVKPNPALQTKSVYVTGRIQIDVLLGNGKRISQDLPVTVRLPNRISSKPARTVYFRRSEVRNLRTDASSSVVKEVVLTSKVSGGWYSFKVTKIEITEPHFRIEIQSVEEGREYKILIEIDSLPDDPTRKSLKGNLIIHTDDELQPTLKLRVLAFL